MEKTRHHFRNRGSISQKVCISIWGDKINEGQLLIGNLLKIDFDIESREYNTKWYNDIKAWKVELIEQSQNENSINKDGEDISTKENDILPF